MRKVLIWFAGIVVFLVAAALIAPNFLDWNKYKAEIAAATRDATGRDLVIKGDLDLAILPAPRLSAADIRLSNIKGAAAPEMVAIKALTVSVKLLPLLQGNIEVDSVMLDEPVIRLEKLADGRANWEFKPREKQTSESGGAPPVTLGNLRINRGTVIYSDGGNETRIAGITMDLSADSLEGPFAARGDLIAGGTPLSLEFAMGRLKADAASPFKVTVGLPSSAGKAEISGSVAALAPKPRVTAKLRAEGGDLRRVIAALSGGSRTALPELLGKPFSMNARLRGGAEGGEISQLDLEFGGVRAAGTVTMRAGTGKPSVAAKLQVTRIDLDEWLKGMAPAKATGGEKKEAAAKPAAPFTLPDIEARVELGVDAVKFNGQNLRGIELRGGLSKGVATIQRAAMLVPGGGEAKAAGTLQAVKGKPAYAVQFDMAADNLRSVLQWAGADIAAVPSDRLRRASVSARIDGGEEVVRISAAKIGVDATTVNLAATIALRDRPAFGATVTVDALNLDAYAPRGQVPAKPADKNAGVSSGKGPLAALQDFDANLRVTIRRLTANGMRMRDIRFDGTLAGGKLTVKQASVADAAGARASVAGTLSNLDKFPIFSGSVSADAKDGARTLRALGVDVPPGIRNIGALRIRGKANTGVDNVALDLSLGAAGGQAAVKGRIDKFNSAPAFDLNATATHPNLARLLAILGSDTGAKTLGALSAKISLKGDLQKLAAVADIGAAGGRLAAHGALANLLAKPGFDLTVSATHPAAGTLARTFAPRYRPQGGKIGPFKLDAVVKGGDDRFNLSKFDLSAGKASLTGTGTLNTGGTRPVIVATLTGKTLDFNPFLPAKDGVKSTPAKPAKAAPRGTARPAPAQSGSAAYFPDTPFDTAVFGLLDADLSVQAAKLKYRQFEVDSPTIKAVLKDRVMAVNQLSGKMFDGAFNMNGRFDTRTSHSMKASVSVSQANVGKALFTAATVDLRGGITDFSMNLTGAGKTPHRMIRSLNGSGTLSSRDGIVKGFDLDRVNNRLKNLNRAIDFISLFRDSMSGGQTKFNRLDGTFAIKNGVLTSNDVKLLANSGEGRLAGTADLPKWHMDFTGEFNLTGHKSAPPFGMRMVGPLDNPRRIFQIERLQTFLLQRGVGSILQNILGGQKKQPASSGSSSSSGAGSSSGQQNAPAQEQKQPEKVTPETIIRDVLPGIFRGLGGR